jgi:hypothetical protein
LILELFQGKCFAAGPAAELDVFSGPVEEKPSAALGADGDFGNTHESLVIVCKICEPLFAGRPSWPGI